MKRPLCLAIFVVLTGGALVPRMDALPPSTKRGRGPLGGDVPSGTDARGRGDRAAQARLQNAPLEMRTSGRKLQLEVRASDPVFAALEQRAAKARTDEEKRAAWNQYYTRLYGEMRRRKPALREYVNLLEKVARSRFDPPIRRGEALDNAGFDRAE